MPYTINKTNGNVQTTITDGTADSTTSLSLLGKNFAGYGDEIATNFLHLLENFANDSEPEGKITGQIWYNTSNNTLQVYNGAAWQSSAKVAVSSSEPAAGESGDLWWDSDDKQLYAYGGGGWTLIGPSSPGVLGKNGQFAVSIPDSITGNHTIIKEYVGGKLVAVYSKDPVAWTPNFNPALSTDTADMITGFNISIQPGINFPTDIGNIQFNGIAANSSKLNNLSSTDFLRANVAALTTGSLTVRTDSGFVLGAGDDLLLDITGGQDIRIKNQTANANIAFSVSGTGQILAPSGYNANTSLSLTTKSYVDTAVLTANSSVATQTLFRDGSTTIIGNLSPDVGNANVFTFGTSSIGFSNIYSLVFTGNLSGNVSGTTATLTGNLTANNLISNNTVTTSALIVNGGTTAGGHINPSTTGIYDIGNVGVFRNINATTFTGTTFAGNLSGNVTGSSANLTSLTVTGNVRINGSTSGFVRLQANAVAGSTTYTLPSADGAAGQTLTTNGSGVLSWSSVAPTAGSNGYGTRTVSTLAPSGGSDGDIWYQVAS